MSLMLSSNRFGSQNQVSRAHTAYSVGVIHVHLEPPLSIILSLSLSLSLSLVTITSLHFPSSFEQQSRALIPDSGDDSAPSGPVQQPLLERRPRASERSCQTTTTANALAEFGPRNICARQGTRLHATDTCPGKPTCSGKCSTSTPARRRGPRSRPISAGGNPPGLRPGPCPLHRPGARIGVWARAAAWLRQGTRCGAGALRPDARARARAARSPRAGRRGTGEPCLS